MSKATEKCGCSSVPAALGDLSKVSSQVFSFGQSMSYLQATLHENCQLQGNETDGSIKVASLTT